MITKETEWLTWVGTQQAITGLPRLLLVCKETQSFPAYKHRGIYRQTETQSILKITLSGEGRFEDGQGEYAVRPGYGFLCKVSDPATGYRYPPGATAPWRFIYMAFEGADGLMQAMLKRHGPVFPIPEDVIRRLQRFHCDKEATMVVGAMEGARFTFDVLTSVGEAAEQHEDVELRTSEKIRRISQMVMTDARSISSVQDLAQRVGISREYLARIFHSQAGTSPRQFLEQIRLREACLDLKETSMEVKEIAAKFGYSSHSHFSRAFLRRTGMSPRRFREVGSIPMGYRNLAGDARTHLGPDVTIP